MQPLPSNTDVLIVGAGPTGLALAVWLRQAGIDHVIIDKLAHGQNTSRAAVIHAHTLEMLEPLGVAGELCELGLKLKRFAVRDRDRALLKLNFGALPTTHQYILMLPQDVTESVLEDRLVELGGTVHRGAEACSVVRDVNGTHVGVRTADGTSVIQARYVVGADGMHSLVRTAAAIEFEGAAYEDSFVLADVRMDWYLRSTEVSLFFSPSGMMVVAPLPDGSHRIVATMEQAPEKPDLGDIQAVLDFRGPRGKQNVISEVVWSSRFRIHHRVATAYRRERLFVMGDAAHVHSPAGGQGMNTGLVDAVVLGHLLSDVISLKAPEHTLDDYERLRRPAAREVVGLAGRLTKLATARGTPSRVARNTLFSVLNVLPPAKRMLAMNFSGLSRKSLAVVA